MATTSNRSAGSQVTKRGIVQGTIVIDPDTGLPVDVLTDLDGHKRLAVDAALSVESAVIEVKLDEVTDAVRIADPDNHVHLKIENDGSINVNTTISSISGDSILPVGTEDGTPSGTQHNLKVDSSKDLAVKDSNANTALGNLLTELQAKTEPADAQNIRPLLSTTDSVAVPGVATAINQATEIASLASIDSKLSGPVPITGSITATIGDLNASKDDVAIAGTENGTSTGTVRHFVNNIKQQILATHDRVQAINYADFGTKNERITSIVYTSATFPGYTATKTISYTLVSGKYRRDSINWTVS